MNKKKSVMQFVREHFECHLNNGVSVWNATAKLMNAAQNADQSDYEVLESDNVWDAVATIIKSRYIVNESDMMGSFSDGICEYRNIRIGKGYKFYYNDAEVEMGSFALEGQDHMMLAVFGFDPLFC